MRNGDYLGVSWSGVWYEKNGRWSEKGLWLRDTSHTSPNKQDKINVLSLADNASEME